MSKDYVEIKAAGEVKPKKGTNPRHLQKHQRNAIKAMDRQFE